MHSQKQKRKPIITTISTNVGCCVSLLIGQCPTSKFGIPKVQWFEVIPNVPLIHEVMIVGKINLLSIKITTGQSERESLFSINGCICCGLKKHAKNGDQIDIQISKNEQEKFLVIVNNKKARFIQNDNPITFCSWLYSCFDGIKNAIFG